MKRRSVGRARVIVLSALGAGLTAIAGDTAHALVARFSELSDRHVAQVEFLKSRRQAATTLAELQACVDVISANQ